MPILVPFEGPYQLLLTLGFAVGATLAWQAGRDSRLPPLAWAILLGTAATAGLIGSKLLFFDLRDALPGERTVLGGILLGVTVVPLAAWALGLRIGQTLDRLSVPTLVAMAIGRVGCFLAGCCLGTHSELLEARHPTVLYEAILDLALVALLLRRVPMRHGVRIGAAVLGYASIRFLTEFVRDGREIIAGLNPVQWFMLVLMAAAAIWSIAASRLRSAAEAESPADTNLGVHAAGFVMGLAAILVLAPDWLTPLERFIIGGTALAVGSTGLWLLTPRRLRVLGIPALGGLAIAAPVDTLPRRELEIGVDGNLGSYERLLVDGGCGSPSTFETREISVTQASIVRRTRHGNSWNVVSLLAAYGNDASRGDVTPDVTRDVTPLVPVRAIGIGLASSSDQAVVRASVLVGDLSREGKSIRTATPVVGMRLGRQNLVFAEGQAAISRFFPTTGEFSYIGLGLKFSSETSRLFVGFGDGVAADFHLPIGERFTMRVESRTREVLHRSLIRVGGTLRLSGAAPK